MSSRRRAYATCGLTCTGGGKTGESPASLFASRMGTQGGRLHASWGSQHPTDSLKLSVSISSPPVPFQSPARRLSRYCARLRGHGIASVRGHILSAVSGACSQCSLAHDCVGRAAMISFAPIYCARSTERLSPRSIPHSCAPTMRKERLAFYAALCVAMPAALDVENIVNLTAGRPRLNNLAFLDVLYPHGGARSAGQSLPMHSTPPPHPPSATALPPSPACRHA